MAIEIRASCERELDIRGQLLDQILADLEAMDDPDFVSELQQAIPALSAREEEHRENMEFLAQRYEMHMRRVRIGLAIVAVGVLLQIVMFILRLVT